METKIQSLIIDTFSLFHEATVHCKAVLAQCRNSALLVESLSARYRKVNSAQIFGSSLQQHPYLKEKISMQLHKLILREITNIKKLSNEFEASNEKLINKCRNLQQIVKENVLPEDSSLLAGTSLQPPLHKLEEYSYDIVTLFTHVSNQLSTALILCPGKKEDFSINLETDQYWNHRVQEIIAYTSFCK